VPGGGAEHAYLPAPALLLAAALALVLVGFLAAIVASARGTRWSRIPLAAVAAVPPLGFTLQEHLEAWLASGGFPATAALEPTFAVGLALQLPLVLAALILARGLLATASRLGSGLRSMVVLRLRPGRPPLRPLRPNALLAPAPLPLASSHAPRAPRAPVVGVAAAHRRGTGEHEERPRLDATPGRRSLPRRSRRLRRRRPPSATPHC
jgi:hypothetical protein